MIGIINTGLGNIPSISSALNKLDCSFILCSNKNDLDRVNKIILPGVGSFKSFHEKIQNNNMFNLIDERVKNGTPILGICLGFHALFEKSLEFGNYNGFNFIKGKVENLTKLKISQRVPHVGWNNCKIVKDSELFNNISNGSNFYFTHSYTPINVNEKFILCKTIYGIDLITAVQKENIFGTQFHPEKSQKAGLELLKNFARLVNA